MERRDIRGAMLELSRMSLRSSGLRARHCERSEAIHRAASGDMDCVAALAMTWVRLRDLAACFARGLNRSSPSSWVEGAGKTGCLLHPRSRVRFALKKMHTSIQVQAEHPGLPCAVALRLTSRSSRRTALLPPSPALLIASLTPAPRRPNHATSPYASGACVSRASRVHRIPPRVRDVRNAPLIG
jgi:hypothetical protein